MAEGTKRFAKVATELNITLADIQQFLTKKSVSIIVSANTKVDEDVYTMLLKEFQSDKSVKLEHATKMQDVVAKKQELIIDETPSVKEEIKPEKDDTVILIKDTAIHKMEEKTPKIIGNINDIQTKSKSTSNLKKETILEEELPLSKELKDSDNEVTIESPKEEVAEKENMLKVEVVEDKSNKIKKIGSLDLESLNKKKKKKTENTTTKTKEKTELTKDVHLSKSKKNEEVQPKEEISETPKEEIIEANPIKEVILIEEEKETTKQIAIEEEKIIVPDTELSKESNIFRTKVKNLETPTVLGQMAIPEKKEKKPIASSEDYKINKKKKRRRINKDLKETPDNKEPKVLIAKELIKASPNDAKPLDRSQSRISSPKPASKVVDKNKFNKNISNRVAKPELTEDEINKQIKETLARLSDNAKSKSSKYRRLKRDTVSKQQQDELDKLEEEKNIIKVTEFVTVSELASMINVQVTQIISTCMSLGLFVSINQRLNAEILSIVAEEFGYKVEFVSAEIQEQIDIVDDVEDDEHRSPIVTVMGHVDHGKTSLLDHIRNANVIAGEAGGITQHIGAYEVTLKNGKRITFIDTPGHEAFTAMRARGAQITDIAIIVVAADDNVMPQTKEAINHAQAAGVPLVFAINKIDKPSANPEKIKEELAGLNLLVEDWGGKYQSQEISAKQGLNVDKLLDKILLEAELLELKANYGKKAVGTVIESSLDKGRGYVATVLVRNGSLRVGDTVVAGCCLGKIKAMYNERGVRVDVAGPSVPVQILGLNSAPQSGDKFNVISDEKEAKSIVNKRTQLQREQGLRTQKHITLDEIGRRIAIGDFKELNIIVKGDVDGSIEALSDSLIKLSTEQIQVNIIHKAVGPIIESDVLLASASEAIIIGFQVRPTPSSRRLAENEKIEIKTYSIIYNAINEIKAAMEGMLAPKIEEKIVCNVEVRETFKITKAGTVAGCIVLDGKMNRNTKIRLIRNGIVTYTGELSTLKRYKDDVKEVSSGQECGLTIYNFNDIKVGDIIEGYEEIEVKPKL